MTSDLVRRINVGLGLKGRGGIMGALEDLMTVRFLCGFNGRSQKDSRSESQRRVNTPL